MALSVACNVIALIDAGSKTVNMIIKLKKNGSLDADLFSSAGRLEKLSEKLETSITNAVPTLQDTESQRELLCIARDCSSTSKKLRATLTKISTSRGGAVVKVFRAMKASPELKDLDKAMTQFQQILQTRLIKEIWSVTFKNRS